MDEKITMEITNDKLEAAIKDYATERTMEKLTVILNLMHPTRLLVPAMLKAPNQPVPCFLKNTDGKQFLAVYTSKEQIPAEPKSQAILSMPFPACNSLVVKTEAELIGMVVNPFTDNLVLSKSLIEKLHEADEKAAQMKKVKLTPEQFVVLVKKQVEFGVLPKRLFAEKGGFIERFCTEKEAFVHQIFAEQFKETALNPYTEADYSVMGLEIGPDLTLVRVDFPEDGIVPPLCYRVYFTYDPITEKAGYYTIEKMPNTNACLLGGFLEDGKHVSYGTAPTDGAELERIITLARSTEEMTS